MSIQDLILSLKNGSAGGASTGSVIVLAVVAFLAVFVIGVILYFFYQQSPQGRIDALLDSRAENRSASKWPMRIGVVVLLLVGLFIAGNVAGRPSSCAQCHRKGGYVKAAKASPHKDVSCLACHGGSGVTGGLETAAKYGRWVVVYTSEKAEPKPKGISVPDDRCLRCHANIKSGVTSKNGIRVRHKDFLDDGAQCRDCHNTVGHGDVARERTTPSMDDCVSCHDGKKASSDCKTCHIKDELQLAAKKTNIPKVKQANSANCYGCHDQKPCLRCHGITMPHPAGWGPNSGGPGNSGSHAREGFTKRELCWRCHYSNGKPFVRPTTNGGFSQTPDGCTCHGSFGNMHGGASWVKRHGLEASGRAHGPEAECGMCHQIDKLCVECHDPSILKQYNPQPGNESYQRDVPKPPGYWEY